VSAKFHIKEVNYKALGSKRPHDKLLTEAEAITEHVKRNAEKKKHEKRKRTTC